jgi:hypothetical protein
VTDASTLPRFAEFVGDGALALVVVQLLLLDRLPKISRACRGKAIPGDRFDDFLNQLRFGACFAPHDITHLRRSAVIDLTYLIYTQSKRIVNGKSQLNAQQTLFWTMC